MPQGSDSLCFAHVTSMVRLPGSVSRLGAKRVAPISDELFPLAAPLVGSRGHVEHGAAVDALADEVPARPQGHEVVLQVQRQVTDSDPDTGHVVLLWRGIVLGAEPCVEEKT